MASNTKQHHVLADTLLQHHVLADTLLQHYVLVDTFSTFSPLNEKDDVTDEKKKKRKT